MAFFRQLGNIARHSGYATVVVPLYTPIGCKKTSETEFLAEWVTTNSE
jgi:hypothetical protein